MTARLCFQFAFIGLTLLVAALPAVQADPIQAGTTLFPSARAIQDVTVFANASINPTGQDLFFDDLFGISSTGIVREAQVSDSIDFSPVGWAFEGSNVLGDLPLRSGRSVYRRRLHGSHHQRCAGSHGPWVYHWRSFQFCVRRCVLDRKQLCL